MTRLTPMMINQVKSALDEVKEIDEAIASLHNFPMSKFDHLGEAIVSSVGRHISLPHRGTALGTLVVKTLIHELLTRRAKHELDYGELVEFPALKNPEKAPRA